MIRRALSAAVAYAAHLGGFIASVRQHGGRFRQDFPPECVPIRRGEVLAPLADYVKA